MFHNSSLSSDQLGTSWMVRKQRITSYIATVSIYKCWPVDSWVN